MRAIWYDRTGPASEVLTLGEFPTPVAAVGEVRVQLQASGVNPADTYRRQGLTPMEFPRVVPNSDGAGFIDQVGAGVSEKLLGKRVWLYNGQRNGRWCGTAAEFITLPPDLVTLLPDHVDFAAGATLGIPCMTAHRCLFVAGPVQGRTVLVTGGAGAVGYYAIQLAKWAGAAVIATVSSDAKAQRARAAGADAVIDYKREDAATRVAEITNGAGVDHVVEVDLGGNLAATLEAVRLNGSIAFYATSGNRTPTLPVRMLMQKNLAVHAVMLPTTPHEARRRAQSDIAAWLESGKRSLTVAGRYSLAETAAAHNAVERGDKIGTVVVEPHR